MAGSSRVQTWKGDFMENELKVVVVKPEQYPEVALVENVEEWFKCEQ